MNNLSPGPGGKRPSFPYIRNGIPMFNNNSKKIMNPMRSLNESSIPVESFSGTSSPFQKFDSHLQSSSKLDQVSKAHSQMAEIEKAIMEDSSEISYS